MRLASAAGTHDSVILMVGRRDSDIVGPMNPAATRLTYRVVNHGRPCDGSLVDQETRRRGWVALLLREVALWIVVALIMRDLDRRTGRVGTSRANEPSSNMFDR